MLGILKSGHKMTEYNSEKQGALLLMHALVLTSLVLPLIGSLGFPFLIALIYRNDFNIWKNFWEIFLFHLSYLLLLIAMLGAISFVLFTPIVLGFSLSVTFFYRLVKFGLGFCVLIYIVFFLAATKGAFDILRKDTVVYFGNFLSSISNKQVLTTH